jgi:hypothetical protein
MLGMAPPLHLFPPISQPVDCCWLKLQEQRQQQTAKDKAESNGQRLNAVAEGFRHLGFTDDLEIIAAESIVYVNGGAKVRRGAAYHL